MRGATQDSQVPGVIACTGAAMAGLVFEAADDGQLFLERRQRRDDGRQVEVRALVLRRPLVHDGAMRESRRTPVRGFGAAAVFASAVAAGIIASSSGNATAAPTPCSTVRRERCFRVMNMARLLPERRLRVSRATPSGPFFRGARVLVRQERKLVTMPSTIAENR